MSTPFRLRVPHSLVEEMLAQAVAELPNECCGLLAGTLEVSAESEAAPLGRVVRRYPLVNAAANREREYLADPRSLFEAVRDMRGQGFDILAIYHSHPVSRPVPSRKDLAQDNYPGVIHFIISLETGEPRMRGWWLYGERVEEAVWDEVVGE